VPVFLEQPNRLKTLCRSNYCAGTQAKQSRNALKTRVTPFGISIVVLDQGSSDAAVTRLQPFHQVDHFDGQKRIERLHGHVARSLSLGRAKRASVTSSSMSMAIVARISTLRRSASLA
jgi:hypothetical protein